MERNYWSRYLSSKLISRRSALAMSGVGMMGAAALISGCGGGGGQEKDITTLLTAPKDTSRQAKRGGIYEDLLSLDENNLDPLSSGNSLGGLGKFAYSRPLREKAVPGGTSSPEIEGDLAESWELSNDGLRLTLKLRPEAKWDPRAPTNGRSVDADDWIFSWKRYSTGSPLRTGLFHGADQSAGVESVEKIDGRTVVYKMAFPWSPLIPSLATGVAWIMPRESEDKFNPKNDIRGSATWIVQKYEPSVSYSVVKNPNWWQKDLPYLDGFNWHIIPEYTTQISQFRAKGFWSFAPRPDDILGLVRELPVNVYEGQTGTSVSFLFFGSRPGSPFLDARVRRAVSMAVDRELFASSWTNADAFKAAGIPLDLPLDSHVAAGWRAYWLDPRGNGLGEGAKYFRHDVAEAKKLVGAAGYANGLNVKGTFAARGDYEKRFSVMASMLAEVGINVAIEGVDYNTVYLPRFINSQNDFDGMSIFSASSQVDLASTLHRSYSNTSLITRSNIPDDEKRQIDSIIQTGLREFDAEKYRSIISDVQRRMAVHQPLVSYGYQSGVLELSWPWVQNWSVFRTSRQRDSERMNIELPHVWIDETKKV